MSYYYFTFGSDERFPYGRDDFVMVEANNIHEACAIFRAVHPNRPGSDCLNCASIYTYDEFNKFRDICYPHREPIEMISIKRRNTP